jgi:electron transfer flavoprotein alpha subunit
MIRATLKPSVLSRHIAAAQQARFASSLVYLEHKGGKLNDSSLSAVTAAKQVDSDVSYQRYPA